MPEPHAPLSDEPISRSPQTPAPRAEKLAAQRTFLLLTLAAFGMACLLALLPAAGHDQMWLLYAARLHLHGAALYGPQIFETNPPLILWLSTIPEALTPLTHLPDTALGKLFVAALECGIAALCLHLLRRLHPHLTRATLYALAFAFVSIFAVMPARDFGQRDHLLILLILPYVFAAALRAEAIPLAAPLATAIGVLALAGIALKPHQILIPIAIELLLLARVWVPRPGSASAGSPPPPIASPHPALSLPFLRPEIAGILLSGLAFLAAIYLFAPLYITTVLPLVRDTYWAYHLLTPVQLFVQAMQLHILLFVDLALGIALGWRQISALPRLLLAAGVAATFAYYLQGTGWYYQQLPALSLLALALVFLLLQLTERRPALRLPRWSPAAALALALLALVLTAHFMNYPFTAARSFPLDTPDPVLFAGLPPGAAVMTLSPTVDYTIQPIFKYHLTLGERYPAFLMLPALLRSEFPGDRDHAQHLSPARIAQLDALQLRDMVEDLDRWHPQLLLVERCQDPAVHCQSLEDRHDNLLAFFLRDPAFRTAFAPYRYLRSAGPFDAFTRVN